MVKNIRNSNHELLRIIAMYMIVFIHANMYLNIFSTGRTGTFFNGLVNGICNTGVTCFILISGYYGVKFNLKKLVKMECMMISYSLLETAILYAVFPAQLQGAGLLEQLVKSVLPFITRKYWFYSCYICLFLLSGYIHKFINSLKKQEFERLLLLLLALFSVFPTLFYFELNPDNGKGLLQMIMIYMIGRYIKLYQDKSLDELIGKKKAVGIFLLLYAVNGISHELPIQIGGIYHHLCKDNSITNIVMSIFLFYFFKEMKFQSRLINRTASYVFAVFALNNSIVKVTMHIIEENAVIPAAKAYIKAAPDVFGFLLLAGLVLFIQIFCLTVGFLRDLILGRLDQRLETLTETLTGYFAKRLQK